MIYLGVRAFKRCTECLATSKKKVNIFVIANNLHM